MANIDTNIFNPENFVLSFERELENDELRQFSHNVTAFSLPPFTTTPVPMFVGDNYPIHSPGDVVSNDGLVVTFVADERLVSYRYIKDWIEQNTVDHYKHHYTDITLTTLTSHNNASNRFYFTYAFPVALSSLDFTTTAEAVVPTFTVDFVFSKMELKPVV